MAATPKIKICGLSTNETLEAALAARADMVGFVFFEPSPRHLSYDQAAGLAAQVAGRAEKVALVVDANDRRLDDIERALDPDYYQLHGFEPPERARAIREAYGKPVIKAIKIAGPDDLKAADAYIDAADMLLYDAKAPDEYAALPGGNGVAFDWTLLDGLRRPLPVMLSGGLDADNVAEAIRRVAPDAVDVSSGVERAPGEKDAGKIAAFVKRARESVKE